MTNDQGPHQNRQRAPRRRSRLQRRLLREARFLIFSALCAVTISAIVIAILDSRVVTAPVTAPMPTTSATAPTAESPAATMSPGAASTPPSTDSYQRVFLRGVPIGAQFLDVSFDNAYYCYLTQGKVEIHDIGSGHLRHTISAAHPIVYALMLTDSDLILYFYKSGDSIHISTYNIASKKTLAYRPFPASPGAKIVHVSYAVATNLVFVVTRAPGTGDTIYRVDIMNVVTTHKVNGKVANFVPSETSLNVYHQDTTYTLYHNYAKASPTKGQEVQLLGRAGNDDIYLLSHTNPGSVEILNRAKNKIVKTITVPPGIQGTYQTRSSLYASFPDKIVQLSVNPPATIDFAAQGKFVAIVDKTLYFLPPN